MPRDKINSVKSVQNQKRIVTRVTKNNVGLTFLQRGDTPNKNHVKIGLNLRERGGDMRLIPGED